MADHRPRRRGHRFRPQNFAGDDDSELVPGLEKLSIKVEHEDQVLAKQEPEDDAADADQQHHHRRQDLHPYHQQASPVAKQEPLRDEFLRHGRQRPPQPRQQPRQPPAAQPPLERPPPLEQPRIPEAAPPRPDPQPPGVNWAQNRHRDFPAPHQLLTPAQLQVDNFRFPWPRPDVINQAPERFHIHIDLRNLDYQRKPGAIINQWMVCQGFYDPRKHVGPDFLPTLIWAGVPPSQINRRRRTIGMVDDSKAYENWLVSKDFPDLLGTFYNQVRGELIQRGGYRPFEMYLQLMINGDNIRILIRFEQQA